MATGGSVRRSDLGAWLLKCNPTSWDLPGFWAAGERRLTSWAVRPGYRSAMMRPTDRVLWWVSGDGRTGFARGIWGLGQIVAEAEPWVEDDSGFWQEPSARNRVRARVAVDIALLEEPVTDTELRTSGIGDLEVQRQPFAANPSWLSREQLVRLEDLLP